MQDPRKAIVKIAKQLAQKGLISGSEGNISVFSQGVIYTTPAGVIKENLTTSQIVIVNNEGKILEGPPPSSELKMHMALYKRRPDIKAIIHTHPPYTLALNLANIDLTQSFLIESEIFLKNLKIIPFVPPGSLDLAQKLASQATNTNIFILEHHGVVTIGKDVSEALNLTLILEKVAQVIWLSFCVTSHSKTIPNKIT